MLDQIGGEKQLSIGWQVFIIYPWKIWSIRFIIHIFKRIINLRQWRTERYYRYFIIVYARSAQTMGVKLNVLSVIDGIIANALGKNSQMIGFVMIVHFNWYLIFHWYFLWIHILFDICYFIDFLFLFHHFYLFTTVFICIGKKAFHRINNLHDHHSLTAPSTQLFLHASPTNKIY